MLAFLQFLLTPRIHFFNFSPYIFNISLESTFVFLAFNPRIHFLKSGFW
ncbi:hypothetical protein [Helicobacter canis]|nr:hypothetical protein [Helicobacter canis]